MCGRYRRTTKEVVSVVDVKVILHDPALSQLEVPAVFCPDGNHDPGRFPGFEDDHHCIVLGMLKVRIDKVITPSIGCIQDRHAPFLATVLKPILKLLSESCERK